MRILSTYFALLLTMLITNCLSAQEEYKDKIDALETQKEQITQQEKKALKQEVSDITERLEKEFITVEEAKILKENAAKKRALNIENRIAIIDNQIALLERNEGHVLQDEKEVNVFEDGVGIRVNVGDEPWDLLENKHKAVKYDRRTYSDLVIAFGLNNAIIEGESLNDSPYEVWGSRFFEIGWNWRTRVFARSNIMRIHYGFSFQFNGLKSKNNQYFVLSDGEAIHQEFEYPLDKSKLRMDNIVFPVHFEFGPSRTTSSENRIRYSIKGQFRIGMGGYGGFNMRAIQKLKYRRDGHRVKDKLIGGYNTNSFIYGVSAYAGVGCVLVYAKYDLNPIFNNATIDQRNISMGLRFLL